MGEDKIFYICGGCACVNLRYVKAIVLSTEHRLYYEIYAVYAKEKILLDSGKAEEITEKYEQYMKQIKAMNGGYIYGKPEENDSESASL